MRKTILIMGLLAAGCGGPSVTVTTGDGTKVTTSANGSVSVATGNDSAVTAACADKPEFVPLYAGAKLTTCVSNKVAATGRVSGTAVYTSDAAPGIVLAWSKDQAVKAGLEPRIGTDTMFSATQGDRTLAVMAAAEGSGSQVTVNWGEKR